MSKLDVAPPTLAEIDQRIAQSIAAEHEFMIEVLGELVAHLQDEWEARPSGAPGPSGPPGAPGKLPIVKLWEPERVFYEADVVAFDGGTFQALRDTGQPPSHKDWLCLAVSGHDGRSPQVRGTFKDGTAY